MSKHVVIGVTTFRFSFVVSAQNKMSFVIFAVTGAIQLSPREKPVIFQRGGANEGFWVAVRRRRRATAADILLTPPPPIVTDRRAAAAADRMSASRRRRFRDVFTSCCTPAICC